jgi:hypothetical protein
MSACPVVVALASALRSPWSGPADPDAHVAGPGLAASRGVVCLAALGAIAARTGGASPWVGALRVTFWGALAMAATAGVGSLFGAVVS